MGRGVNGRDASRYTLMGQFLQLFRMYGSNRPYMVGRRMDDMVWSACK